MTTAMIAALLAVLIVTVVFMALGGRRRRRRRQQIQSLATGIDSLRRAGTREMRRRTAGPADAPTGEAQALYDASTKELRDTGLTILGDLVEEQDDGSPMGTSRWFVDSGGTICGWFAAITTKKFPGKFRTLMLFFSESEGGHFLTTSRGAPELGLARPPTTHRQFVPWSEGVGRALERHRSLVDSVCGAGAPMRHVATRDEVVALLLRLRTHIAAWRAAQAPDALLEADARNVLRDRYSELGPELLDHMRGR